MVVSSELFDIAWHELLLIEFQYYNLSEVEKTNLRDSFSYIPKGVISPDSLPNKTNFFKQWWSIFSDLSSKEKYNFRKIRGRLFKNWWFAEKYYSIQLTKIKFKGEGI